MTQHGNVTIDPTVTNGSQLAANINGWRAATLSLHSGVERPAYAVAGTMWLNTASTPWKLCVFDGVSDTPLGEVDPKGHAFVSAGGTGFTNDLMTAGNAAEARNKLGAVSKSGDTVTGEIKASNDRNFRMMNGDRGVFWHLNSEDLYLMITNSGDQTGGWNNTRALRVRLSDGFIWLDRVKSNTNFGVGGATVQTDGNINGSRWSSWGNSYAFEAISNRIEDRANAYASGRAPAGAECQHNSGTVEFAWIPVDSNRSGTTDLPAPYVMTGVRGNGRGFHPRGKTIRNR